MKKGCIISLIIFAILCTLVGLLLGLLLTSSPETVLDLAEDLEEKYGHPKDSLVIAENTIAGDSCIIPFTVGKEDKIKITATIRDIPIKFTYNNVLTGIQISTTEYNYLLKQEVINGKIMEGDTCIVIDSLIIGEKIIPGVEVDVISDPSVEPYIGQDIIKGFGNLTIDYINNRLIIVE